MNAIHVVPIRLAAQNGHSMDIHRPTVGATMNVGTPFGRQNVTKAATGVAMLGGGIYALMSIPQTKKVAQYALGGLGAGLLVAGSVSIYDALA